MRDLQKGAASAYGLNARRRKDDNVDGAGTHEGMYELRPCTTPALGWEGRGS